MVRVPNTAATNGLLIHKQIQTKIHRNKFPPLGESEILLREGDLFTMW